MSAGSSDQQQKPSHTQFKTVFIIYSCFAAVRVGNTAVFFHCLSLMLLFVFCLNLHNNDALVQLLATQTHKQQAFLYTNEAEETTLLEDNVEIVTYRP